MDMRLRNFLLLGTLAAAVAVATPTWGQTVVPAAGSANTGAQGATSIPDFSGIWEPLKNKPCPPEGCPDFQTPQEFANIGWGLKSGLPYQKWAADLRKSRIADNGKDDPGSHCLPTGIVKLHTSPLLKKIIQTPGLLVILNERNMNFRQLFTLGSRITANRPPRSVPETCLKPRNSKVSGF